MPVRESNNNRILAANSRAADVAEKAIQEILPVMQQRYYNAFRPQGIESILYTKLTNGRPCTCQARRKRINGLLNEEGKASIGAINQMISGALEFNVTAYNQNRKVPEGQSSPNAPDNKYQGVFDVAVHPDNAENLDDIPFADLINGNGFGDNGPVQAETVEEAIGDLDAGMMGHSDNSCPICFGSGYIGGYTPFRGHRQVLTCTDVQVRDGGVMDTLARPLAVDATGFDVRVVLPRGAILVDALRVWNDTEPTPARFTVDSVPIRSAQHFMQFCDGRQHILGASGFTRFTHLELQFGLSAESVYFEFPKRPSGNNTALLEKDEPFNIIMSPNCPRADTEDIIVERQFGKALIVQNTNPWNTRERNILGWEAMVRVTQPQEIFRLLPRRARTQTKPPTTLMARDNVTGIRRT
ncbi:hypothetical protein H1O16_gp096 [Burkholderia phage BcepSaruman]|uniref:Uncharacterized protein n=1 Tax=Burkholderia phage BcepSaruman TaxID=2530032 RepID=A0A4D5ZCU9_9CAUD|nr:hypothetical protein H1O16_gp096 [Burkholderia phage BcepSaruman]QBX06509.1 hypothetical protein BcepSaruman_096 [Burkholderia phage BcepSaruman]